MAFYINEEQVLAKLNAAIEAEVNAAFERVIEKAKQDLDEALRKQLAGIAMSLHKRYRVEMGSHEIKIIVENNT